MAGLNDQGVYASGAAANEAARAITCLMDAARKRSVTVQAMPGTRDPREHGLAVIIDADAGCRFEIIDVASGGYTAIVRIHPDGSVVLDTDVR